MDPRRERLSNAVSELVDSLVNLVAAGVAERLRPQLGELVAIHGAASAPSAPGPRPGAPADLLTLADVARLLNVPKSTVSFWTYRSRVLPHVSLGAGQRKLCRIRRADLEAFIAHGSPPSGPRGSAREQALELLQAADQRAEVRQRRRVERREASPRLRRVGPGVETPPAARRATVSAITPTVPEGAA